MYVLNSLCWWFQQRTVQCFRYQVSLVRRAESAELGTVLSGVLPFYHCCLSWPSSLLCWSQPTSSCLQGLTQLVAHCVSPLASLIMFNLKWLTLVWITLLQMWVEIRRERPKSQTKATPQGSRPGIFFFNIHLRILSCTYEEHKGEQLLMGVVGSGLKSV